MGDRHWIWKWSDYRDEGESFTETRMVLGGREVTSTDHLGNL